MDVALIRAQAIAVRAALSDIPVHRLDDLRDRMNDAGRDWNSSPWEGRAAAHARNFTLIAELSDDPVMSPVLLGADEMMRCLLLTIGPRVNGIILNSRLRLLEFLVAGDPESVAVEIERNLTIVYFMWLLAGRKNRRIRAAAA